MNRVGRKLQQQQQQNDDIRNNNNFGKNNNNCFVRVKIPGDDYNNNDKEEESDVEDNNWEWRKGCFVNNIVVVVNCIRYCPISFCRTMMPPDVVLRPDFSVDCYTGPICSTASPRSVFFGIISTQRRHQYRPRPKHLRLFINNCVVRVEFIIAT